MLIILFGLAGSGKNYVGEILGSEFDYFYWDADQAMPNEMREAIHQRDNFTQEMRDNLTTIIIEYIANFKTQHSKIVVSQALYKEKNRNQLLSVYPEAKLIEVKANLENRIAYLKQRNDEIDQAYAEKIYQNFEEPIILHGIVTNNSDRIAIINQLKKII